MTLEETLLDRLRELKPGYSIAARTFSDEEREVLDHLVDEGRVVRGGDAFMQTGYWLPEEGSSA